MPFSKANASLSKFAQKNIKIRKSSKDRVKKEKSRQKNTHFKSEQ